ncbi:hypothetical protein AAC387_Pa03g2630 [Persea americana]
MRNAVFPSFSSSFYSSGSGNNQAQMQSSNASTIELERLNGYSRGFFHDSQLSNDLQLGRFTPLSTVEASQELDYIQGADVLMTTNPTYQNISHTKFASRVAPVEDCMGKSRKRTVSFDTINNQTPMKESKKKSVRAQEQYHQPSKESSTIEQLRAPVRRSNKLGERITALQQLVSPFGKTDTASVLQEATVHIKLLKDQIQVLSTPYFRIRQPFHSQSGGEEKNDLRSRGLCLVPVSSTANLTKEDGGMNRCGTGRQVTNRF